MAAQLMQGKRGLIMGLANDKSIAWGIAKALSGAGAELAFSYQGDALKKRVEPLAAQLGSDVVLPCDVADAESLSSRVISLGHEVSPISFSADGTQLLLLVRKPGRSRCLVFSMPDGHPVADWEIASNDPRATLAPNGRLVATGHEDGTLRFWSIRSHICLYQS